MYAPLAVSIVAAHRQRVLTDQRDQPRFCNSDAGQLGKRHRGVLDERHVDGLIVEELDDPLHTANVDERLRLCPAETAAGVEHLAFEDADRCLALTLWTASLSSCACFNRGSGPLARG